jgi:hypothetical protein
MIGWMNLKLSYDGLLLVPAQYNMFGCGTYQILSGCFHGNAREHYYCNTIYSMAAIVLKEERKV